MRILLLVLLFFMSAGVSAQSPDSSPQPADKSAQIPDSTAQSVGISAQTAGTFVQTDSCSLRISILTCGPGEDLYSIFGHSAIRVTDMSAGTDIVYNYGTMEFDDFGFYLKFIKGEMLYYLSVSGFDNFILNYQVERRSVIEQQLQLTCDDKRKLLGALQLNATEDHKYYNYSFLYDNCSSRIRDMVSQNSRSLIRFNNILPKQPLTFRDMIHEYLHKGQQHWSKLGIDLLLGALIDKKVTNEQAMFLPDYLMKGFDSASILLKPDPRALSSLVSSKKHLYQPPTAVLSMPWFNPYLVLTAFSIILLILSFRHSSSGRSIILLDKSLFFVTGLLGVLMLGLWLFRDDTVCRNNLNIAWALPTHAVVAWFIAKGKPWVRIYFKITGILGALLLLGWPWWPQELNNSLIPVVMLLIIRSFTLSKKS
jgi:uncharacterized protein DUF4105